MLKYYIKNLDKTQFAAFIDDESERRGGRNGAITGNRDLFCIFLRQYLTFKPFFYKNVFFSSAAMKNRELLDVPPGDGCPLANQHVCLVSAHRCSCRKKKEA